MGDFSTCSLPTEQVRRIERGRYEDAMASSTAPRGLHVLAGRCFDLQSADWCCNLQLAYQTAFGLCLMFYYKETALFLGFYSGFTRGEYHIVCVDFIAPCGGTKGRRRWTLRSPSPPSSGLHLLTPGVSAAAGHFGCRGLCQYRIPVSGAGR